MRLRRLFFSMIVVLSSAVLPAQNSQDQAARASGRNILTRAAGATSGGIMIGDIVLSGTVHRSAGSTSETGRAELKALATGEASIDLTFPSGTNHEVYAPGPHTPLGEWSGPDGQVHAMAYHNLLVDPAWFCPALILQRAGVTTKEMVVDAGEETLSTHRVQHLRASHVIAAPKGAVRMPAEVMDAMERATQFDLYLDSATSLPVEMTFNVHPDNHAGQDVPIRIRYSDYRSVNGVQVPFHIQRYINNTLSLDLQLENAALNSGLAPNSFVVSENTLRRLPQ